MAWLTLAHEDHTAGEELEEDIHMTDVEAQNVMDDDDKNARIVYQKQQLKNSVNISKWKTEMIFLSKQLTSVPQFFYSNYLIWKYGSANNFIIPI